MNIILLPIENRTWRRRPRLLLRRQVRSGAARHRLRITGWMAGILSLGALATVAARRRLRIIRWMAGILGLGALATVAAILAVLSHFHGVAAGFDLSEVERTEPDSTVLDNHGQPLGQIFVQDRKPVKFEQLPDHFIFALLATEDVRFFEHAGYDLRGMARAAMVNLKAGAIVQGGSSISQQLARHAYGLRGRSFTRKLTEIFLARRIETSYSKADILEFYVNRIYLGNGCWGVGPAAQAYFDKEVQALTVPESAMICGIIKRPAAYSPFDHPAMALQQRNVTLRRMAEKGFLPKDMLAAFQEEPLAVLSPEERTQRPHYLLGHIKSEALGLLENRDLTAADYVLHTSIDSRIQNLACSALSQGLARIESRKDYPHQTYAAYQSAVGEERSAGGYLQGAVVVIHNLTGQIVAAEGGRDYSDSQYNRVFQAKRPPGTAFLPLVYAAAFESTAITPRTMVADAPMDNRKIMIGGQTGVLGEWGTEDHENRYQGEIAAAYALLHSKNAASASLGEMAGLAAVKSLALRAGIRSELRDYPSTFLGSSAVSLLELTRAYTLFANGGWLVRDSTLVRKVTRPGGAVVFQRPVAPERTQVVSQTTAAQVSGILQASLTSGPGRDACHRYGLSAGTVAGKTGTAYEFTDGWFVGYNRDYTCGVWVGFDKPKPIYPEAFGGAVALSIWASIMKALDSPGRALTPPEAAGTLLCLQSGARATRHCMDERGASLAWKLPLNEKRAKPLPPCPFHKQGAGPLLRLADVAEPPEGVPCALPVKPDAPIVMGADPYEAMLTLSAALDDAATASKRTP